MELRHFVRWRDRNHPHLRELDPALVDDWVFFLREHFAAGLKKSLSHAVSSDRHPPESDAA